MACGNSGHNKLIFCICLAHMQHYNAQIRLALPLFESLMSWVYSDLASAERSLSCSHLRHCMALSVKLKVICLDMIVWNSSLIGNTWFSVFERRLRKVLAIFLLSQISLKGFRITEADSLPVKLLGALELCTATRHYLKNIMPITSRKRACLPCFSSQAIKTILSVSNCQTFQRDHLLFQMIFRNNFSECYRPWSRAMGWVMKQGIHLCKFVGGQFLKGPGPISTM